MDIFNFELGPILTNCYLIIDNSKKRGVVVDCPPDSAYVILDNIKAKEIQLDAILLTHSHWDHFADAMKIKRETDAKIYIHKEDEYRLLSPNDYTYMPLPFDLEPVIIDNYLADGDAIEFGNSEFEIRHTPGHTEGSVCFVNFQDKVVFSGDTLFYLSIGRTDLPGGSTEKIISSIHKELITLPDEFKVYPGHGSMTTIGFERQNNPFLLNY